MISGLGYLTLALAFLLAIYGLMNVIWGLTQKSKVFIESARLAILFIFPLMTISLISLGYLLLNNRFDVAYVYSVTSRDMPSYLKITALWGGQSGSLLFWNWTLACFSFFFFIRKWDKDDNLLPWTLLINFITIGFFLGLSLFSEIPFERFWHLLDGGRLLAVFQPANAFPLMPQDGQGLNPLLRHPGMIWHPPTLYLGFVGFIIPYSLAFASLAAGRKDSRWLEIARPWALAAWVFLSLGLVLGMRWAYDVLGWGGYWGWDPVEIAALMPWLSATALLHTAILQRRRESFKRWNVGLAFLTFVLVIFGTFLTRSGVLSSVHSFAGSDIGQPMFFFTALITLGSLGLLVYRWQDLRNFYEPEFKFSREVLILFTNLVLLSILMVCFLGVIYPLISELLTNNQITVGPAWYKRITGPLFALLLLMMGFCPLAAWSGTNIKRLGKKILILAPLSLITPLLAWIFGDVRSAYALGALWLAGLAGLVILAEFIKGTKLAFLRSSTKFLTACWETFWNNHRRYGGLMVHLGIVLMSLGIIGIEGLQQQTQATLALGESVSIRNYIFTFDGVSNIDDGDGLSITEAEVAVTRDGVSVGVLYPQRQIYLNMGMAITHPGLQSGLAKDIYAILLDWHPISADQATFRIYVNPLVNWLWIGTGVLTIGAVVAGWPERRTKIINTNNP